jgi:dihydrofolate reductase
LIADEEIHQHYTDLLNSADTILYGRITYQLMEYWLTVLANPTGDRSMDDFAKAIDKISKVVFSRTLKNVEWKTARLAGRDIKEEVEELRQQQGGDILVGSRSLIAALLNLGLIDELQLCVQPILAGSGLPLFENINDRVELKLRNTKTFSRSGSVTHYYEPTE